MKKSEKYQKKMRYTVPHLRGLEERTHFSCGDGSSASAGTVDAIGDVASCNPTGASVVAEAQAEAKVQATAAGKNCYNGSGDATTTIEYGYVLSGTNYETTLPTCFDGSGA
jgi:hypothetical protein